jgi:FkbM family methyltransferase
MDADEYLHAFRGYTEEDIVLIESFANPVASGSAGFITDFMGIKIRVENLWKSARELDGRVLAIPIPKDFHAHAIEWVGLFKSVKSAQNQYVAMELGAGIGPWLVAGAIAAKRQGIRAIRLYGVEADAEHFQAMRQHFADNGIDSSLHQLYEGVAGIEDGTAYWPDSPVESREDWGNRPEAAGSRATYRGFTGKSHPIKSHSVVTLLRKERLWDLLHIDIQGDEVAICRSCLPELNRRVRRIVVGTHSRKIDAEMLVLLHDERWILEREMPTRFAFRADAPSLEAMTITDGTQIWLNPRHSVG